MKRIFILLFAVSTVGLAEVNNPVDITAVTATANGALQADGSVASSGDINVGGQDITNAANVVLSGSISGGTTISGTAITATTELKVSASAPVMTIEDTDSATKDALLQWDGTSLYIGSTDNVASFQINKDAQNNSLKINALGIIQAPAIYTNTVTSTRDVEVQSDGKLGYVSSTQRDKKNIRDLPQSEIDKLKLIKVRRYDRKDDTVQDETGAIAEEADLVGISGFVSYDRTEAAVTNEAGEVSIVYGEDKTKPACVNWSRLVPLMLAKIQELEARIVVLEGN